ncbi:MAG: hypothetical protein J6D03_04795 [Clostridia bacterium]|nr:hypothetical protein [Clostridia bacterium]
MNLGDFNIKNLGKDLLQSKVLSDFVNNFINELKAYLEKGDNKNIMNVNKESKYSNYWDYQNFMEDNVAATIGLSRWGTNITYYDELNKAVDDSILEISESEGTLYRKQFSSNGSANGGFYNVDKFENGEISHISISEDKVPKIFKNEDIIFQFNENEDVNVRTDLREKVVNLASEKSSEIKVMESKRNNEYKKEGHIYEAFEDDGYIFLNDITEERDFSIEDIDFVVDNYKGEGKYQVINGEYKKID